MDKEKKEIKFYVFKENLMKHSDYFSKILNLSSPILYLEHLTREITIKNVDYISFYQILFYCNNGYFPNQLYYNMYDWISLLIVSSRFLFQSIFNYCEYQLKNFITKETIEEISEYASVCITLQLL